MKRSFVQRVALALAGVVGLLGTRPATANAQKALVYCPVNVDATGCNAIVNALTGPGFPLGVDRGYDGTGGTLDLKAVDLFSYSVFVVPSLADGSASQPYAVLRDPEVVEHLKAALIGRIAMWSGTPDQGATNRVMKDALIQNLAGWAAASYGTARGPGLVTLLDASASAVSRYDWVRAIAPLAVTADANLLIYNSVRALNPRATSILTSGAGPIAYTNMATFGFQVPNGAAGVNLDAVGQTGTSVGGQVVLLTMEAGNSTGTTVLTDKDDYAPGTTVVITGAGWEPGETVKLTLHVDPVRESDTELTAVADGSGAIRNEQFAPAEYDLGVRFVLTAAGLTSGKRAQTTFTDGGVRVRTSAGQTVTVATRAYPGSTNSCSVTPQPPGTVSGSLNVTSVGAGAAFILANNQFGKLIVPVTSNEGGTYVSVATSSGGATIVSNSLVGSNQEICIESTNGSTSNLTELTINYSAPIVPNVAPSFTKGSNQTINEDAPAQTVASWATGISAGPPSEGGQVVDFIVSNDNNDLFTVQPAISPTGTLTYVTALNAHGSATVTVQIHDNGGTANGGVDTSAPQTFTITVNSVNDAPTFTKGADETIDEDAGPQTVPAWATVISAGPTDENGQTVTFSTLNDNNPLFSVQPTIAPNGTLTYTPAANAHGTAVVTVTASDDGGTANGGDDTSDAQTFTITLNPVNDEPSFTAGPSQTVNEDAGAQLVAPWATGVSTGPNEATQTVSFTVTNDNNALFAVQPSVSPTGELTYTPASDAFGTATVTVLVKDDGGTTNGGDDTSPTQTFTITVTSINDAPSFTKGADQTVDEDAAAQTVTGWAAAPSAGPANESGQTLTFNVSNDNAGLFSAQPSIAPNGTLTYTPAANQYGSATVTVTLTDDGTPAATSAAQTFTITVSPVNDEPSFTKGANQTINEDAPAQILASWATAVDAGPNEGSQLVDFQVTNDNNGLFSAQPAIAPNGTLTYTPAPNAHGSATVTVRIHDDGGTANGGDDLSEAQTFTITVNSVNDAPSFTKGGNQTALEDSGPATVGGWAGAISEGPADEEGQALAFNVSNDNNALFSVQPAVASDGTLTFTPAPNAFGSAIVTISLSDDGGTANGGDDTSDAQTFTITVTPVNDAPSFTRGADQSVAEDAGAQTVPAWATAVSAGPNETQTLTFQVSTDNAALFAVAPSITASGTLSYTPAPNANGVANVSVTLKDDGGTANGGVDATPPQGFTITINAVNDAPSFAKGDDQTVLEDSGPKTVSGWATSITAGPPNESSQTLTFTTSSTNPSLFSVAPAIDATTGTLTYTVAPNANGSATVTVTLKDDGGVANGGVDQSQQSFEINVTAVNDVPSFVKGPEQTVLEDVGAKTVAGWATAISKGPTDESAQTLTFNVTSDNTALFSVQPAIDPATGTLTYTPALNANGTATVTVVLSDNGGTANGGDDTSDPQTFTITVTAVNDAPTYDLIPSATSAEDAGIQTVSNAVTAMSVGPANEAAQTFVSLTATNNNTALFTPTGQPTVDLTTGTLTYTAAPNANGTATVTVTLKDNGGTANGGVDQTTKTFTITVTKVNDAPVINGFTGPIAPNAVNTSITMNGSFTDIDLGDVPMTESHTITIDWGDATAATTHTAMGSGTTRSLTASHTYASANVYTVTLTVTDLAGSTATTAYKYVVVYDPNAGFVTGGGWITSPAGAYTANPTLAGKATFGFVSKYKKGANVPDGNTEFQFHAAGMNFKSSVYEWLVVAGAKAQFKGTGTIDGAGNYGFLLTAIDGQLSGGGGTDKFRIKIWDKNNGDAVVYDNQLLAADDANPTTLLGGGSINIQAK